MKPELLLEMMMNAGLFVSPDALETLQMLSDEEIERIIGELSRGETFVVTKESIEKILRPRRKEEPRVHRVKILQCTSESEGTRGELSDFMALFLDRYRKISGILKKRPPLFSAVPISSLLRMEPQTEVEIIGMVTSKTETPKGHILLELEDPTGSASVWIFNTGDLMKVASKEIVPDEIIGVRGVLRESRGKNPSVISREILWPEFPLEERKRAEDPVCVAFISDLHIGSKMFLEGAFKKFLKWLRGQEGGEKERALAEMVKYVLICGDIVDGIGIYPQQEKELSVTDVFEQYRVAAELLSEIPEDKTVVVCPGNHDAVRTAEPQPPLPKEIAQRFYDLGFIMVSNPCTLEIEGVTVLMYHGRSFDDLVSCLGMDREKPTAMMRLLLRKRHLAPIYGGKTALAPGNEDKLVIEQVPDIVHSGHVHIFGHEVYHGIHLVCSSTFQSVTSYMKKMGINPTPGLVPVLNLKTGESVVVQFA